MNPVAHYACKACGYLHPVLSEAKECCPPPIIWSCGACGKGYYEESEAILCCTPKKGASS